MSGARFKGVSSIEDMLGWQKNSFENSFKIGTSGISEYTMEQIKAKAAILDLNDGLTTQAVSLAKDADLSAKAATGKLTFKAAIDDNKNSISDIGKALEKSDLLDDTWKNSLVDAAKNGADEYENQVKRIINQNKEIGNSIITLDSSVKPSGSNISSYFKGILATAKQLAPVLATIGVAIAAYKGFQFLDDKFTLTFSTAQKHMEESASAYESNYSELQSINSELETTSSRIAELKSQGTLTIAEEAELAKLERQNSLLEAQQKLKQSATDAAQKQAASDAATSINFKSEKSTQTRTDRNGMDMEVAIDRKAYVREQVALMEEAQRQIDQATEKINSGDKSKKWEEQLKTASDNLNTYKENATNTLSDLNSEAENLYDESTGNVIKGYEGLVNEINGLNNLVNNFDLSGIEKNQAAIESFFDGSAGTNFLKDELIDVAKSGEITTDTLADMGLTLEDLGLSGKDGLSALNKYFKELASSADEANSSVKEFDGSLESITNASESENQDKNWNTVSDLFDKAKELDKNKKWGTDDFQSMAQFIAPESAQIATKNTDLKAADYKDLWDKYKSNFEKYFNTDNPLQSAINAQDKLLKSGLGSMDSSGIIKWSDSFKSSADAAKAWGISVEAAEVAMHNLESYGAEFDGITFNAEELENYKSSLDGIRAIYDQMDEGSDKDRLGKLLQGWDEEYAKYEQDISTLNKDQVVKIKFEYDLASIQSQIDEIQELINSGDNTVKNNAELIAGNQKYINTAEQGLGFDVEGVKVPVEYEANEDTIEALKAQLKRATSEDDKLKIQAEIENLQELQKDLLNAFSDAHPEINADSSMDEINAAWDDFVKSTEGQELIANITANDEDAKETIAKLLGIDVDDIIVDVEANDNASDTISTVLSELMGIPKEKVSDLIANDNASPEVISFLSELSGIPESTLTQMNAEDGATALITYVISQISNVPESKVSEMIAQDNATGVISSIKYAIGSLPSSKRITITTVKETINRFVTQTGSVKKSNGGIIAGGAAQASGTMLSHAHVYGTVRELASQNVLASAYVGGKVGLDTDQYAVINELGQESLIRDGIWRLLPPGMHMENLKKGDIILNAKQTSDLLKSGKTTGTARAYASGSLLAPAYASGMLSLGSSYGKSYGSTTSKASTTKKSTTDTTTKAAQEITKATKNLVDFIKILLDRTQEVTKRLTDAIDDAVGLADKMSKNSSALTQIQKEISVNQNAYNQYMAQAKAVGLSETYAKQIRNGSLNISNITDENLKDKIDKYQEYFEAAQDCQDTILDLQREERDLALERLDYIESYYDALVSLNDAYKDVNETQLEYLEKIGSSAISDQVKGYYQDSYAKEYDSYGKALQQLSDYTQEVSELLDNGYLQEGSEDYLEAMKTIQEFTKQVDESAIALVELEDKIREIDYTKLQQLIDGSDRRTDQLKNAQSLAEARDEQIGRDEYQKQVDELSKSINANYALRDKKLQEQNLYDVTSTRYQELAKEIADLDGQIYDNLVDIEDLKDQVFEAEFFDFEKEQSNLEYFIDELEDFASLLNEDAFIDKTGAFTDEAYAKIALTADAMAKCKQQIANATEALNKLDEMYQNGLISETEYEEKQRELLDTVRENSLAINDYKNELLDLYKEQMRKENEALKENISLRKKALENQKAYWSYADSIKSKTKDVDALKAQIDALDGVSNSAALAQKKRLQAELAEAEKDLNDTKRDHQYDLMQDGYDQMSENLDKSLEDLEYSIATSSDKQLQIVQSMLNQMVASYQEAYSKIDSIINETGFKGTDSFNDTVSNTSSSSGASSIANGATQSQSNVKPSDSASNINSSNTSNSNHGAIESDIKKEPNTDNRLCAELTLSKSSVSVQEGSSTSVSASIRPNDAKNKTLSWTPKDPSVVSATADGKITGLKSGNTTIIVSTTDGSGLNQSLKVTVTKKPEPPKPVKPTTPSTPQGNGVPDVGDKVTFVSGIYHEDSYGNGRWGNQELGKTVYITKMNPNSPYPIHISKGNKLGNGDRGWLKLNQLKGYYTGSRRINRRQWAFTDDTSNGNLNLGSEVIVTKNGVLRQLDYGEHVFNNEQVQKLWDMTKGNFDFSNFLNLNTGSMFGQLPDIVNRNDDNRVIEINQHFDTLLTIENGANVSKEAIPGLQKEIDKMIPRISDKLGTYLKGELKKY